MAVPTILMELFPPSTKLLLDVARKDIDDATLMAIARADHGYMADEAFAQLCLIRQSGTIPTETTSVVWEVLELTRWCEPTVSDESTEPKGRRGRHARLFACAALLRADSEGTCDDLAIDSTWANTLVSARAFSDEIVKATASLATWRYDRYFNANDEPLYLAIVLLISAMRLRGGLVPDLVIGEIADWVLTHEGLSWRCQGTNPPPCPFGIQHGFWQPVAAELEERAAALDELSIRERVQMCALLINP